MTATRNPVWGLDSIPLRDMADAELVRLLTQRNADAMEVIFDRYYRMVMRVALHIVRDSGEAQDVVQVVFTDFYRNAKLFGAQKGSLKGWLLQYAYGRSINRKRSLKSRNFYDCAELESLDDATPNAKSKLFDLESPEVNLFVEQALGTLGEKQRTVIEMICFRGMTLSEAATATGESLGNVQHAYYRGIEKLRVLLSASRQEKAQAGSSVRPTILRKWHRAAENQNERKMDIVKARAL